MSQTEPSQAAPSQTEPSQAAPSVADVKDLLAMLYAPIRAELQQVETRLQKELRNDHPFVDRVVKHGFRLGGKRLRPALLLLCAKAVGSLDETHLTLAAVVEMIHTATLVHDDVLDEAEIRRHENTVNARWSNETAVLLGDYLFSHAFYLASTTGSTYACGTIGRSTNIVCEGEMRQNANAGNVNLELSEYLAIINGKTAELCACCCELGAYHSGGTAETVKALATFGRKLGNAFQIADDLLDLEGSEQQTGKTLGTDLAKRKMTLPLIHARETFSGAERERYLEFLQEETDRDPQALLDWLVKSDSLEHARAIARNEALTAQDYLETLAPSEAKDALYDLTRFVIARNA